MKPARLRIVALIFAALAVCPSARAQQPRTPVATERTDAIGMEWIYEESADPMDDKWQVVVFGTLTRGLDRGAAIGLICVEGWGLRMRLDIPRWAIGEGVRRTLQARIDAAPAFQIDVVGEASAPSMGWVPYVRGGQQLVRALRSAQERISIQGPNGLVTTFPMSVVRPEVSRALDRCQELLRTLPERDRPQL